MHVELGRRAFCSLGVLAAVPSSGFEERELRLDTGGPARRANVYWPRGVTRDQHLRGLVLFHGLGETTSESVGVRAWAERYGLLEAHGRLQRPPLRTQSTRGDLTIERARAIDALLREQPYDGRTVFICPYTPNVWRTADPAATLERLASWTVDTLLPEVRSQSPGALSPSGTAVDGCSLGGFVALEIFLRRPEAFVACGGVQSALREASTPRWAARLAEALDRAGPRPLRIGTSRGDPFYRANVALARELGRRDIAHELAIAPGPHDQPWLREVGTLEMLLWHDRLRFAEQPALFGQRR